jgi:ketosteroid isomerase-like protein
MHRSSTRGATSALALAALVLGSVPAFAQPSGSERTAAAVMQIEQEWLAALNRHDEGALARILGQEFIDSDFQGDAITRARYLGYFAHPVSPREPRVQQSFRDTKVRFVAAGDVAIVTGVVMSRIEAPVKRGRSLTSNPVRYSRFTDVFVWRDGRWQAVTGQETHFTSPAG